MTRLLAVFLSGWMAVGCAGRLAPELPSIERRGVLNGVGFSRTIDGDLVAARQKAVKATLRDMAFSARAVVRARSTCRLRSEKNGDRPSETLSDLVEVRAFQILASRRMKEDVGFKAGVYRVHIRLTEEALRESIDETHRARRLHNVAKTEAAKNPIEAERKLRQVMDWIEDAGLQTGPTGFEFLTSAEAISR